MKSRRLKMELTNCCSLSLLVSLLAWLAVHEALVFVLIPDWDTHATEVSTLTQHLFSTVISLHYYCWVYYCYSFFLCLQPKFLHIVPLIIWHNELELLLRWWGWWLTALFSHGPIFSSSSRANCLTVTWLLLLGSVRLCNLWHLNSAPHLHLSLSPLSPSISLHQGHWWEPIRSQLVLSCYEQRGDGCSSSTRE